MNNDFLGVGMKFPPQVNPATGRIITVTKEESIKESIYLILMTRQTERLVRPDFGANVDDFVFMDVNITTMNVMCDRLVSDIITNEPRVMDVSVDVDPQLDEGRIIINIDYTVIDTNNRENMVFPYYLEKYPDDEEERDEALINISQEELEEESDEESEWDFD